MNSAASTTLHPLLSPLSSPKLDLRPLSLIPRSPTQPVDFADCIEHIQAARERTWSWRLPAPSASEHNSHLFTSTHEPDYSCAPLTGADSHQPPNFPPEIWQLIFEACLLPKADIGGPHPRLRALDAPLILRRVCRQWNAIVLETGPLWSSIHVSISAKEHRDAQDRLEWIKSVVNKRPADFIFDHVSLNVRDEGLQWGPFHDEAFNILSTVFARCRFLDIDLPDGLLTGGALRLIKLDYIAHLGSNRNHFPVKTPHLRGFRLSNDISMNSLLPTTLQLPRMSIGGHNPNFGLPISQLTTLALDCPMSLNNCMTLLSLCQERLERLQLSAINFDVLGTLHEPLDLQQLRFMKLVSRVDLTPLFSKMVLQNLESIELILIEVDSKPQQLNIPWDRLIHLNLDSDISLPEMWKLLHHCPKIVTVTYSGNMFNYVSPGEIEPISLQNLSTLRLLPRASCPYGLNIIDKIKAPRLSIVDLPYIPSFFGRLGSTSVDCLTTLKLSCPLAISLCREILSSAPSLKSIDLLLFIDSDSIDLGMVYANSLEEITITSTSNLEPLFTNFYAPELQSFTLKWDLGNEHEIPPLASFLSSIGGLRKLTLFNTRFTESIIMDSLAVVSDSLTHLQIENTGESTDITHLLGCLTWDGDAQTLCPQLETLRLSPCTSQDGALGAMVQSRQPGKPHHSTKFRYLDSAHVGFRACEHEEDLRHLAAFSILGDVVVNLI